MEVFLGAVTTAEVDAVAASSISGERGRLRRAEGRVRGFFLLKEKVADSSVKSSAISGAVVVDDIVCLRERRTCGRLRAF